MDFCQSLAHCTASRQWALPIRGQTAELAAAVWAFCGLAAHPAQIGPCTNKTLQKRTLQRTSPVLSEQMQLTLLSKGLEALLKYSRL